MSHYEERLQSDLDDIRARVSAVGAAVGKASQASCLALLGLDRAKAAEVILGDLPINRAIREIDRRCHYFVARHLPSAGVLRFISSVLRLNIAVERIGDYAATIARQTVQLSEALPDSVKRDVELMMQQSTRMLEQAMRAFTEGNAELARGTKTMAAQVDSSFERVFPDLLREGEKRSRALEDILAMLVVFSRLERISDQAKNICEETIFAVTGETKEPKRYRILFVDERNDCWSLLAEAIARKAFPESGVFASAGWAPAGAIDEQCLAYLQEHGLDEHGAGPSGIPVTHEELDEFHVIVNVGSGLREHLADHPFKTLYLNWNLAPERGDGPITRESLEEMHKQLSVRIRDLMTTLRGEDAA